MAEDLKRVEMNSTNKIRSGTFPKTLAWAINRDARPRVPTIDTLRGISIIMVLYIHLAGAWRAPDWSTLLRLQWYATEFFGPAMFITISLVGNMVSHFARKNRDSGDQSMPMNRRPLALPRKLLLRSSFLFIVGECINAIFTGRLGLLHLTGWNMITTIALFGLLIPVMLRIPKIARLLLAASILLAYYPIMNWSIAPLDPFDIDLLWISPEKFADPRVLVYWFLFFHDMMAPVFSWLAVPLIASVVFESMVSKLTNGDSKKIGRESARVALVGVAMILIGIVSGFQIAPDYVGRLNTEIATPDAYIQWPWAGVFIFWIKSTPQYIVYNLGIVFLAFSAFSYVQIGKKRVLPGENFVNSCGRFSLTIFIASYILSQIPLELPLPLFYILAIPIIISITWVTRAWEKHLSGVGSIEWMMNVHVVTISFLLDKMKERKKGQKTDPKLDL
ncbi:MAG: heparan-alpha-glucosaminide N-acetyltransferase domain-containing protein [Candidatus Sigynarchaeota archaeon]